MHRCVIKNKQLVLESQTAKASEGSVSGDPTLLKLCDLISSSYICFAVQGLYVSSKFSQNMRATQIAVECKNVLEYP